MIDILWMSVSFACALLAIAGRLPPMIGYLGAGFILHFFGIENFTGLKELSDLGISLLLFSIGLKLDLKSLGRSEVLGVAIGQGIISFIFLLMIKILILGPGEIISSSILAFGMTFSSTIFVVKVLEQRGDFATHYGRIAVGVLVIQDILAVLFMAFTSQKTPSAWLILLITSLWPIKLFLSYILTRLKQSEMIVLFGLTVSFGGAYLFDLVNVKGDLGALIIGILLSNHHRSAELNRWLISFKDFFLVGFFLSIGMIGFPSWSQVGVALGISLFLPMRLIIYFILFNRARLRNRSSLLSSAVLTNFSEFGLIVCSFAVGNGYLESSWLTTLAMVLTFSFIISALLNSYSEELYIRYAKKLKKYQQVELHPLEKDIDIGRVDILVIGMGRVGQGAYINLKENIDHDPLAVEVDTSVLEDLKKMEIEAIYGNATSPDFWQRIKIKKSSVKLILLAMPLVRQNCIAAKLVRSHGFKGTISSIAKYPNDEKALFEAGIDKVFNLYAEAGTGFAKSSST